MGTTKTKRPSRDKLAQYFAWEEEQKAFARKASDIRKLQDEVEQEVLAFVRENGGPERCSIVCGYRLSIEVKAGRVEWKTAFMKELGQEKAEELLKAAGTKEEAKIEPPSP
jgi:hypothetical protein